MTTYTDLEELQITSHVHDLSAPAQGTAQSCDELMKVKGGPSAVGAAVSQGFVNSSSVEFCFVWTLCYVAFPPGPL